MMIRALFLALACACAAALSPLAVATDDSDCALYLSGPGRSSAYDYSINLLKGNFGYDGQHTCITYDAINQAYLEARNRILVSQPKGDWKPEDYASVGELVLDISINLARRYGLTYEEIEKGLPLIDTSRTLIREVCPPVFSHVECRAGKYRRFDGLCNNLRHPTWGATNAPFQRLIGPLFSDGINSPRISHTGRDLPLSRVVSRTMHPDDGFHDHAGTVMVIAWGQFMDHDYTLTGTPLDPLNRNDPEECCKRPPHLKHPYCNEIRIPDDDYFYRLFGVKCIDFVRAFPSPRPGCRLGSRVAFNTLTGVLDGNTVYGVTEKFARKLRTGFGGLLRMNPVFKDYGLKDLLPLKLDIPDEGCTRPNKNMYCFEAGEIRVNEQLVLTVMHTLMAREHNRVARGLAEVNPHWDDETLFQEARRINIAEIQHITYNEFLPILLGKDVMEKFGLVLEKEGYWDGYDPEVNPDVIASFASAAYRFGHSLLPTAVERWSKAHKFIASKRLSDLIRRPYDLYRAGVFDEYVMGLMNQVAQAMDDSITQEVTNHLFKKVGARFGMDLVSFNMQRGREFGIPGYMEFRKFCGLPGADSFQDLFGSMSNHTVRKYETIFEHPIDVDLWSGGVSERPLPGSMLGPTFACIIATQFSYSRRGDRFWFELPNQPSSFTPEQLAEIRKSRLARVICDNTDIIDTVQLYPMVLPDHELNPRVPCRSGIIPGMDFSKWAEPTPFHGPAKHFVTQAFVAATNETEPINDHTKINDISDDNFKNINNSNCNITTEQKGIVQDHKCNTVEGKVHKDCPDMISEQNYTKEQDCADGDATSMHNCKQHKKNEIPHNDTVMKYVYKKDDNVVDDKKSKGHEKNSLRRKRSTGDEINTVPSKHKAPLIVEYETSHDIPHVVSLPIRNADKNIKASALADFNIETIHANSKSNEKDNYERSNQLKNSRPLPPDVEETLYMKHKIFKENETPEKSSEEISQENETSNENSEEHEKNKSEHKASNTNRETYKENSSKSIENNREKENLTKNHHKSNEGSEESQESVEQFHSKEKISEYSKPREHSEESIERDSSNENLKSTHPPNSIEQNRLNEEYEKSPRTVAENSNENSNEYTRQELSEEESSESNSREKLKNASAPMQNADSDEFSYERIQVNEKGTVEPIKENHLNVSNEPIILHTTTKPTADIKNYYKQNTASKESEESSSSIEKHANKEPVNINDGEIKPVVEINSNTDSLELDERNTGQPSNDDIRNENESLETLLGVKIPENNEGDENNSKFIENKTTKEGDLKQQFERIPLNYKHDDKQQNNDSTENKPAELEDKGTNPINGEGTLDAFTPKDENFDEHLNIKFSDVAVKLPEIKLPEDVLEYAREEPNYSYGPKKVDNNNEKQKFYNYHEDDNDENAQQKRKSDNDEEDDDDSPAYYGYYDDRNRKQNYKNDDQSDEEDDDNEGDDDLYEKFVRERFGKRGSFQKRSEKLQDINSQPHNPHLYKTIKNILKKTEEVRKEAEKSGDPKAGYMWTLEYGETA